MYDPVTIDVSHAYRKSRTGDATLVCAHTDNEKGRSVLLRGAYTFDAFLNQRSTLPWHREIIFYSAEDHEDISTWRAEQFSGEFLSTRALLGGVDAWCEAGYPMEEGAEEMTAMHEQRTW